MNKITLLFSTLIITTLTSCATTSSVTPKISHAHIGHALTSWVDTPSKKGLFIVAEDYAKEAAQYSEKALAPGNNINVIKNNIAKSMLAVNGPAKPRQGQYYFKNALEGSLNHIAFAASSADASENIKTHQQSIDKNSKTIFYRIDTITAIGNEVSKSRNLQEAQDLAKLIHSYNLQNIWGSDENGDGIKGNSSAEYGLLQLHDELHDMINKEVPAYRTVEQKYLFGLVRLPDGTWKYRFKKSSDSGYGRY